MKKKKVKKRDWDANVEEEENEKRIGNEETSEPRSCVKVEVDVPGSRA